jgi:hypothetical protein
LAWVLPKVTGRVDRGVAEGDVPAVLGLCQRHQQT